MQTGGPVEMPWIGSVAALLQAWYPGQEAGNAIADVLTGTAEPSGRLPQTFPVRWADNPAHSQDREVYPGVEGKVRYEEGIFVGYRHYDRLGMTPLFPFGFGLGYARFAVIDLTVDDTEFEADGSVMVGVTVTNTADRDGAAVVQPYVSDDVSSDPRPEKELKAFRKIQLKAGESRQVTMTLDARAFAFYRVNASHWLVEDGSFTLRGGLSAADLPLSAKVARTTTLMLPV